MSLQAILFMAGFLAILFAYIYFIVLVARRLGGRIHPRTFNRVERGIIVGIVLGVVFMFQPWTQSLYRLGFFVVLFSTLAFIVWSHISPLGMYQDEPDLGPVDIDDVVDPHPERSLNDEPA